MDEYKDKLEKHSPDIMYWRGQFGTTSKEVTDSTNRPGLPLWNVFDRICSVMEEPSARCRDEAEPGDWYLSICYDQNWYVREKTEDGSRIAIDLPGQRTRDMIETLMYVCAFLHRYNANLAGESE